MNDGGEDLRGNTESVIDTLRLFFEHFLRRSVAACWRGTVRKM